VLSKVYIIFRCQDLIHLTWVSEVPFVSLSALGNRELPYFMCLREPKVKLRPLPPPAPKLYTAHRISTGYTQVINRLNHRHLGYTWLIHKAPRLSTGYLRPDPKFLQYPCIT